MLTVLSPQYELIGSSFELGVLRREIERVAISDLKILITGPTGSGKELVAREIHRLSLRSGKPLVTVNCAALTESLLETELFGHKKGSFTGAHRDEIGKLEAANDGTIFLDEISDMPPRMQAVILRFLELGEIQQVGDRTSRTVDVRVITATNADLPQKVRERSFRKDLYFRLNDMSIAVPPLSAHASDIPDLMKYFWEQLNQRSYYPPLDFTADAEAALQKYPWPGNVRELKSFVRRMHLPSAQRPIRVKDLPQEMPLSQSDSSPKENKDVEELYQRITVGGESYWDIIYKPFMDRDITRRCVRELMQRSLKECGGIWKGVARLLNIKEKDRFQLFLRYLRKRQCLPDFRQYR